MQIQWQGRTLDFTVSKKRFDQLAESLLQRLIQPIERAARCVMGAYVLKTSMVYYWSVDRPG
jgi:hypothetical protein